MKNNSILVEYNTTKKMYSLPSDGAEKMNTLECDHTCGDCVCTTEGGYVKILDFRHFRRVSNFQRDGEISRKKSISDGINVSVVMDIVCGNTSK